MEICQAGMKMFLHALSVFWDQLTQALLISMSYASSCHRNLEVTIQKLGKWKTILTPVSEHATQGHRFPRTSFTTATSITAYSTALHSYIQACSKRSWLHTLCRINRSCHTKLHTHVHSQTSMHIQNILFPSKISRVLPSRKHLLPFENWKAYNLTLGATNNSLTRSLLSISCISDYYRHVSLYGWRNIKPVY